MKTILLVSLLLAGCVSQQQIADCEARGGWWFLDDCRVNTPENRNRAMMLAPAMMQNTTQGFRNMQQPYQQMQPYGQIPSSQSFNCITSNGYTNCY